MNKKRTPFILFAILLLTIQLACNLPSGAPTPDTFATLNSLYTASAQTQQAAGTQISFTSTPGLPLPTATNSVPGAPTTTVTVASPVPVSRCDAARFLADVTYPDGSLVARNSSFVKIWRIQNVGTCTWNTSYSIVFSSGDAMNGPSAISMPKTVYPGEYVEIAISLTAPGKDGAFRGYWKLRNSSGALFGIGDQASDAFWVDIKVSGPSFIAYNFADSYCQANWENNNGSIPCPGAEDDPNGYVLKLNKTVMENGAKKDEPGLLTVPMDKHNGIIAGQYPAFTVQAGDRFRALVNCQYEATKCDVIFRLDFKNNGQVKTLGTWHEAYEGQYYPIDLDLSSLAGQTGKFILVVSANGGQNSDYAIWLNPHIIRQGNAPTHTPTPTNTATPTNTPTNTPIVFNITGVSFVNSGSCGNFTATANVTANTAGTMTYYWKLSDGTTTANQTLNFAAAGTQSVSYTWTINTPSTPPDHHWIDLYIVSPNNKQFGRASFTCP